MGEGVTDPEVDHQEEAAQRRATGYMLEVITVVKISKILVSIIHNNELSKPEYFIGRCFYHL